MMPQTTFERLLGEHRLLIWKNKVFSPTLKRYLEIV